MIRTPFTVAASLALVTFLMAVPAWAQSAGDYYFNVNVPLASGPSGGTNLGTLSGWFELYIDPGTPSYLGTDVLLNYDLTASAAPGFAGFEYTLSDSTIRTNLQGSYGIFANGSSNPYQLILQTFEGSRFSTTSPTPFSVSYENEPNGSGTNYRYLDGSAVPEAAPEPSSWMLAGMAAGVVAILRFRSCRGRS